MDPAVQDVEPPVPKTLLLFPSADAVHRPAPAETVEALPPDRPSERPTRPTLPPPEDPSDEEMVLSERDFVSDEHEESKPAKASTLRPPPFGDPRPRSSWLVPAARIAAAALLLLLAAVALLDGTTAPSSAREPRVMWPERTALATPTVEASPLPSARSCVATAAPRFIAPRALINPGLDVSSSTSSSGFVVALASSTDEASAVRLEGTTLHAAETVRLRPGALAPIRRVVARDVSGDADVLDVRADTDDARTVLPEGDGPAFRVAVAGGYVIARVREHTHSLWALPLLPNDRRIDALRVAPRDDGGAVVVMKRGSTLSLGFVNGAFATTGPLITIARPRATIGTPFVVANGAGAALAWAERANGAREWTVVVASLDGGEMETKPIAAGISPSLGVLPDGTLVAAYADGPAASHRIVVRRLAPDLAPSGDLVVASPEGVNAGQPVVEIRPDGRALVAWLAVSRGQPASVYATPLQCDVSTSM